MSIKRASEPDKPPLATVLLRHDTAGGTHFDWMLEDPAAAGEPDARLWTARVGEPSERWAELREWPIEPIAPHRRAYLTFQGDIGAGRGSVTRIDEGTFVPVHWGDDRMVIDVSMRRFAGRVELVREEHGWTARVV